MSLLLSVLCSVVLAAAGAGESPCWRVHEHAALQRTHASGRASASSPLQADNIISLHSTLASPGTAPPCQIL